jgi:nicotinamidase-related amidase
MPAGKGRHTRLQRLSAPKGAFYRTNVQALLIAMDMTHLRLAGVITEVCVQTMSRALSRLPWK